MIKCCIAEIRLAFQYVSPWRAGLLHRFVSWFRGSLRRPKLRRLVILRSWPYRHLTRARLFCPTD